MSSNLIKNKQLPKGWSSTIIGDLLDFEYGKGLTKKKRNENGKFPVYGSNGIVGYHTNFLIEAPALIIGRKGAAGEVSYSDKNCWPIDTTYFINNLKYLNIKFVFYVLKSLRLNQYDRSTAIPGLNRNDAYELSLNLPPFPEQNQIVAKIEELFSELDNGIENLKKAREQLKTYRQAVLKYAFEGKLTKEWRTLQRRAGNPPEPAEKLLEQIKTEREKHYQRQIVKWKQAVTEWKANGEKGKRPTRISRPKTLLKLTSEETAIYGELPTSWRWSTLCNITYKVGDIDHKMPKDFTGGLPYLSTGNLKKDGTIDFDNAKTISKEDFKRLSLNSIFKFLIMPKEGDKRW